MENELTPGQRIERMEAILNMRAQSPGWRIVVGLMKSRREAVFDLFVHGTATEADRMKVQADQDIMNTLDLYVQDGRDAQKELDAEEKRKTAEKPILTEQSYQDREFEKVTGQKAT